MPMSMLCLFRHVMRGVFVMVALSVPVPFSVADELPTADASLLAQLAGGGFVIYFRHAATDVEGPSEELIDLARCETQRSLSSQGKAEAVQIGEAFRKLDIPIASVIASPFCRTKETAKLAFGSFEVSDDLYFAIDVSAEERARLGSALRDMLSTPPVAGSNTVIVAHTANLREAAGIWPKPEGVAYIFRPLSGGRFEPVAKMLPEDWTRVMSGEDALVKD